MLEAMQNVDKLLVIKIALTYTSFRHYSTLLMFRCLFSPNPSIASKIDLPHWVIGLSLTSEISLLAAALVLGLLKAWIAYWLCGELLSLSSSSFLPPTIPFPTVLHCSGQLFYHWMQLAAGFNDQEVVGIRPGNRQQGSPQH